MIKPCPIRKKNQEKKENTDTLCTVDRPSL